MHGCITRNKMYHCIKLECRISQSGMLPMQRETKHKKKTEQNNVWVIKETKVLLVVAKIRGVISYGMLCSESELNLSDESEGIAELSTSKYERNIGKSFFSKSSFF